MNKTFNLLFFLKKSKIKANGTVPIYLRITIDGKPKEISSKRNILPQYWDSKLQRLSGRTDEVKAINSYLKTFEQQVYDAHHQAMKDKKPVTSAVIKDKVIVTVEENNGKIICSVDDNGIGREQAEKDREQRGRKHISHGTNLIKNRVSLHNSLSDYKIDFNIEDKKDHNGKATGTRVTLTFTTDD